MKPVIQQEGGNYTLLIDLNIYSLEAVKRTAYRFADRASILLADQQNNTVSATFLPCESFNSQKPEDVVAAFCNELLDQDLREIVWKETAPIRNILLAHAFSKTNLQNPHDQT